MAATLRSSSGKRCWCGGLWVFVVLSLSVSERRGGVKCKSLIGLFAFCFGLSCSVCVFLCVFVCVCVCVVFLDVFSTEDTGWRTRTLQLFSGGGVGENWLESLTIHVLAMTARGKMYTPIHF